MPFRQGVAGGWRVDGTPDAATACYSAHIVASQRAIVILGGGGHATVVFRAAQEARIPVLGFFDDDARSQLSSSAQYLGHLDDAHLRATEPLRAILAIGDVAQRRIILTRCAFDPVRVVHPSAIVDASASIEQGAFIGPGVIVHAHACVGRHAIINSGCIIEHDCAIGENSHIAPGSVLAGQVTIGTDTLVGLGSRVLPGVHIGNGCTVAGGAVVHRSAPDGVTLVGVPAQVRAI